MKGFFHLSPTVNILAILTNTYITCVPHYLASGTDLKTLPVLSQVLSPKRPVLTANEMRGQYVGLY